MKNVFLSILIICFIINSNSQNLDYFGIPTENCNQTQLQVFDKSVSTDVEHPIILKSFVSPTSYPVDICFDGKLIWINGYNEYKLYGMDTFSGDIVDTISINIQRPYGMTYKDSIIYMIDNSSKKIIGVNIYNENEVFIKNLPQSTLYPTGLDIFDDSFWFNDAKSPNYIITGDSTINILYSSNYIFGFPSVGQYPSGIVSQNEYLWCTDNITQTIHRINKYDFSCDLIISAPGGVYPNGLTYDGEYLWVINNSSDSIYKIKINDYFVMKTENNIEQNTKIFPTITDNKITIKIGNIDEDFVSINILNLKGQILDHFYLKSNSETVLNTLYDSSLYICQIKSKKETYNYKFIIK